MFRRFLTSLAIITAMLFCSTAAFGSTVDVPYGHGFYPVPGTYNLYGNYNASSVDTQITVQINNWNPNGPNMSGTPYYDGYTILYTGKDLACNQKPYGYHGGPVFSGFQSGEAGHIYQWGYGNWSIIGPGMNCNNDYYRVAIIIYLRGDGEWHVNGSVVLVDNR